MAYTTINDPSAYFQNILYTGNDSASRAITNTGNSNLQPDLIWIKKRNAVRSHSLTDTSRGLNKRLQTDSDGSETTTTNNVLSAQSDGFTVGDNGSTNANNDTYVAWQWKANGGTTSSNTSGSINSTVQVSATSGFSIISYIGNATSGATVGHGLGKTPKMIIIKRIDGTRNWFVYNVKMGATKAVFLDLTNAAATNSDYWNDTEPTSTVFSLGSDAKGNADGTSYIAYAFSDIQGFSKFGSYSGNNNADGPFVYTGFKPAWLLIKNYSNSGNGWTLTDNARSPLNQATKYLLANTSDSEATGVNIDFLSNGFKLRATAQNESQSYIYMAFAQNPLVASNDVIALAR